MTRRTIYRIALATLMLPNFTAYWWLLPRRMKRCRTAWQAIIQRWSQAVVQREIMALTKYQKFANLLSSGKIEPISEREFRIPLYTMRSDGWHIE